MLFFYRLIRVRREEYVTSLRDLGWLIFINAKQHILLNRTELVESVYMLTAVLTYALYYLPSQIKVAYLESKSRNIRTNIQFATGLSLLYGF